MWLLEELKVPYDVEVFHRNKQTMLAPPELEKIHPLGKSPVVSVLPAGAPPGTEPLVLAESGLMTEYLCEHLPEGRRLVPDKWKSGCEGKVGGETEAWMRYRYLLHYAEGSLMPTLVVALVTSRTFVFFLFLHLRRTSRSIWHAVDMACGRYAMTRLDSSLT